MGLLTRVQMVAMSLGLASLATGCVENLVKLEGSPQVPAAEGSVRISASEDNHTLLHIRVHHLARPARLVPGASIFVVWVRLVPSDLPPENVGAFQVNGDLAGHLKTQTPLRVFDLSITPEPQATVLEPSAAPVLTAQIGH